MRVENYRRSLIAHVLALVTALLLALAPQLAGAQGIKLDRTIQQVDYLDGGAVFLPAWEALRSRLPEGTRLFSILIEDKRIAVEGVTGAGGLNRWTVRRARFLGFFDRDIVAGPARAMAPSAGFRAALFDFDDIALDRLEGLIGQAIGRAALEDSAQVTRIEIGSPQIILPSPHYGRLRITLTVGNGHEVARVFATPDGTIVAADLSQTNRAQNLDLLASDDWPMKEAQEALTQLAGANGVIRTVEVGRKGITLRRDNPTNPAAADFLSWDLSGALANPIPTVNPGRDAMNYMPFTLGEVDLARLPEVKRNALAAFGSSGVVITDITARKSLSPLGQAASKVEWRVTAQFPDTPASSYGGPWADSEELGLARVGVDGTVIHVLLPKRLRPQIDWMAGESMASALKAFRESFGDEAKVLEVEMTGDGASIHIEDPAAPGKSIELLFNQEGLALAWIQSSSNTSVKNAFTLSQLEPIGIDGIAPIIDELYRRVGISDQPRWRTTLYGSTGQYSPAGSPQLEARMNGRRQGEFTYRFATGEYVEGHEQLWWP